MINPKKANKDMKIILNVDNPDFFLQTASCLIENALETYGDSRANYLRKATSLINVARCYEA